MIEFLLGILQAIWDILKDASVFLLLGFLLAGVLAVLVPRALMRRLVGTGKVKSVFWASVLGLPLPLCSCGVLPTALGLRKQGATPGATVAFMVATPETGIDSISLTYALTDPTMTIFRPIAGIVTAIAAGLATNFFAVPRPGKTSAHAAHGEASEANEGSDHAPDDVHYHDHDEGHGHLHDHGSWQQADRPKSVNSALDTIHRVIRYGFVELFDDIVWWLALGIVLST